jgi:flagellar hook-length control protein FliK
MTASVSSYPVLPSNVITGLVGTPGPAPARGAEFARMLDARRNESAPAPAPETPKAEAPDSGGEDRAQANRSADETRQRQLRASRQNGQRPQGTEAPAREPKVADEPVDPAASNAAAKGKPAPVDEPADPALADWLATLNLPPAPPETPPAAETAAPEGTDPRAQAAVATPDLAATADKAARGAAARRGPASDVSAEPGVSETARRQQPKELEAKTTDLRADPQAMSPLPATWQAAMEQAVAPAVEARARVAETAKAEPGAAAALSGTAPAAERPATQTAEPTVVHMPTPADAPDFSQVLGAQLSVFAKEGIQQAELHLNPADMGSISIQIAIDGDQAKVDFGADSAATRQLIENGLPELASALRDAGFTLSGGGVHSQAQQQASRERDGGSSGRGPGERGRGGVDSAAAEPVRVTQRTVRAGGVDVYA